MGKDSKIEWTDHTFNPWWGCTKVSPGYQNCYAEALARRTGNDCFGPGKPRNTMGEKYWSEPLKWNRAAEKAGKRARVFCGSMCDVFDPEAPIGERGRLYKVIEDTPHLQWLLLTKRPEKVWIFAPMEWIHEGVWPENVSLGVTMESQEQIERLILLRAMKCMYKIGMIFCSVEPMLGAVDFGGHAPDWVICGGESGDQARPMHPNWARSLRDQCEEALVPFFFKQWGEWAPLSYYPGARYPTPACFWDTTIVGTKPGWQNGISSGGQEHMVKVGKVRAGRNLDGREWNEYPEGW